MVHTVVSTEISAPPQLVADLYADYAGWPRLFRATIGGGLILRSFGDIDVHHSVLLAR
jgi:hypothetical protein